MSSRAGWHDFDPEEVRRAGPDTPIHCRHCDLPFYRASRPDDSEPAPVSSQPSPVSHDPVGPDSEERE
jgi:hypothetical protein